MIECEENRSLLKGSSGKLVVDTQVVGQATGAWGSGELNGWRRVFNDGTDIAHRTERAKTVIQCPSAGLPYALGRVQATQREQSTHFFFPMADIVLLHQTHKFKSFRADLLLNTLGVVFWSVLLFVRRQVCILGDVFAFVVVQGAMQSPTRW